MLLNSVDCLGRRDMSMRDPCCDGQPREHGIYVVPHRIPHQVNAPRLETMSTEHERQCSSHFNVGVYTISFEDAFVMTLSSRYAIKVRTLRLFINNGRSPQTFLSTSHRSRSTDQNLHLIILVLNQRVEALLNHFIQLNPLGDHVLHLSQPSVRNGIHHVLEVA